MRSTARSIDAMRSSVHPRAKRRRSASISSRCASTPFATVVAYGSGGTGRASITSAGVTSFASASYSSSSARSRAWRRPSTAVRSGPGDVLARASVDLEPVTGVHEQRHLHDEAGLHRRRLAGAGHAVALDARLGLAHGELDGGGQVDADDLVAVRLQHHRRPVDDVAGGIAERRRRDVALLVRLVVHEHEVVAVAVEELHLPLVDDRLVDLLTGAERAIEHG